VEGGSGSFISIVGFIYLFIYVSAAVGLFYGADFCIDFHGKLISHRNGLEGI
jgi:hypothetical protein